MDAFERKQSLFQAKDGDQEAKEPKKLKKGKKLERMNPLDCLCVEVGSLY